MAAHSIQTTLSDLKRFLHEQGYQVTVQPPTDISLMEQLVIPLKNQTQNQHLVLRIFWSQDQETGTMSATTPRFLQFFVLFPFIVNEAAMKDLTTFVFNLNSSFDMANFGLYESQRILYYRYVYVHSNEIQGESLIAILASIQFLIDRLLPSFISLASGQKILADLEKETKDVLKRENLDFRLEE